MLYNKVKSQKDLIIYIQQLRKELENPTQSWENDTLASFLSGLEGYCTDKNIQECSWSTLAELLTAATVYE